MPLTSKEQILNAPDVEVTKLSVPHWGEVFIRKFDGTSREIVERTDRTKGTCLRALVASLVLCDEAGNLLFGPKDVEALSKKNWEALNVVFTEAMRVNLMGSEGIKEAGND